MARKPRLEEETEEINIMPLMNIIMLLIPFLIMSTEFIKLGVINVTAPKLGSGRASQPETNDKPKKPPLNLTISVTDKGLTLITRGNKIPEGCILKQAAGSGAKRLPTVRKTGKDYNYDQLRECLTKIKDLFTSEKRVIIMASPSIKYSVIVKIMDYSRSGKSEKKYPYEPEKGKEGMFPEVVLSAGVI